MTLLAYAGAVIWAVLGALPADVFIGVAAVADWRVANPSDRKIKKDEKETPPALQFDRNPDILAAVAALVHDVTTARMSRLHNDANVLVLGGGLLGDRLIRDIVRTWINSRFEGGRHERRVAKLDRSGS